MIDALQAQRPDSSRQWPSWLSPHPRSLTHGGFGSFVFVVFTTMLVGLASAVALAVSIASHDRVPMLVGFVAALCLSKPIVDEIGQRAYGPRGPLLAWTWIAGLAPVAMLCAVSALETPLTPRRCLCGSPVFAIAMAVPVLGALAASVLRVAIGVSRTRIERFASRTMMLFIAVAAAVTMFNAVRALAMPDADTLLESAPVVAHMPPAVFGREPRSVRIGGLTITRMCAIEGDSACDVLVGGPDVHAETLGYSFPSDRLVVRHVARADLFVIARVNDGSMLTTTLGAVNGRGEPSYVTPARLAAITAAPLGWTLGAFAALMLCAYVMLSTAGARQRVDEDLAAFEAGDEGRTLRFFGTMPRDRLHYRDAALREPSHVIHGSMEQLRDAAHAAVSARWMFGVAIFAIASAPLVAFALLAS